MFLKGCPPQEFHAVACRAGEGDRGAVGEREKEMEEKCVSVPLPHIDLFRSSCMAKN